MLWIAKKLDVDDRLLTLAKATCANQVRSLMTDQRSLDALDACFRYANGELTREELNTFTSAAYAAASDAADAADYAAYAAADAYYKERQAQIEQLIKMLEGSYNVNEAAPQ